MRGFILECQYALGDVVLLTGAVRDLHRTLPGVFRIDVRTGFPDLWLNNPYLTRLDAYDPGVQLVKCRIPLVDRSNEAACHCLHGFHDFLSQYLGTAIKPTEFRGDLHLSRQEKNSPSPVRRLTGKEIPFWLVASGGKYDNTIKWWDARRYQEVVNHFRGRIQFVQVGQAADYHPKLNHVIDLRGETTVRELLRLMYHAEGVLCGVTSLMHLAAAVPVKPGRFPNRPCVVIAGGRESPHWEAYPGHQFIHKVGALPCCATGGCWRARTVPLGDGADRAANLCVDVSGGLPRCMDMITAKSVVERIETYFEGGAAHPLRPAQAKAGARGVAATARHRPEDDQLSLVTAPAAAERFIQRLPPYPGGFEGRGIVICGGGAKMFTNAWVCINLLRRQGCALRIQLWHLGEAEMDDSMRALVAPLGVECVDAFVVRKRHPARYLNGWSLKPYALLHSRFEQVLLLDADIVPLANPEYLFDTLPFRQTGALFWPDFGRLAPRSSAWRAFGVPYRNEAAFESGQMVVDKRYCWQPLALCMWYNEHRDFYYRHVLGDKDTFHMAFRKLGQAYSMPAAPIHPLVGTMCQHDFAGRRLFQHRNRDKWNLFGTNRHIRGFRFESECLASLEELGREWDGRLSLFEASVAFRGPRRAIRVQQLAVVRIAACMISCQTRAKMRQQTLARLARTDWGRAPLCVVIDQERFGLKTDSIAHTVWRALRRGLASEADYLLHLEDDLEFNRHFRHNLAAWGLLARGDLRLASLYNPGFPELAWDIRNNVVLVNPHAFFGSQALLISRDLARFFLNHWSEGPPTADLKMGALAARDKTPLLCHHPSLVQHRGYRSAWGGGFHEATDFLRDWRAPTATQRDEFDDRRRRFSGGERRRRTGGERSFARTNSSQMGGASGGPQWTQPVKVEFLPLPELG